MKPISDTAYPPPAYHQAFFQPLQIQVNPESELNYTEECADANVVMQMPKHPKGNHTDTTNGWTSWSTMASSEPIFIWHD